MYDEIIKEMREFIKNFREVENEIKHIKENNIIIADEKMVEWLDKLDVTTYTDKQLEEIRKAQPAKMIFTECFYLNYLDKVKKLNELYWKSSDFQQAIKIIL